MSRFIILSGCSGGGKSTLLDELARRGHATVPEPGRRVVREETGSGGTALPWADVHAFVARIIAMAEADYAAAAANAGWTFFDRGLFDAISGLGALNGTALPAERLAGYPYHRQVFLTPPWPELYATDSERRHDMTQAVAEFERLLRDYPAQGYEPVLVPRLPVGERADFVERTLREH